MDGGYTWSCMRGCVRTDTALPDLLSVSVNVRLGGFGYANAYYNAQAGPNIDGVDYTLLHLSGDSVAQGIDGVFWPDEAKMEGFAVGATGTIVKITNAGVTGWDPADTANFQTQQDTKQIEEVLPTNADGIGGCQTLKTIRDVFFWNMHLAFFVGDSGYICRYGLAIQEANAAAGPGINVDDVLAGTLAPRWDSQGSDEQGLNWGRIVDNNDYMYSNLRAIFCLQVEDLSPSDWQQPTMTVASGITYSQHITCFAAGTHPSTAGTTSAILRYESKAVAVGVEEDGTPIFREDISWTPQNSMTTVALNDIYCVKVTSSLPCCEGEFLTNDPLYCYAVGDGGLIRYTSNGGQSPWRTLFSGVLENLNKVIIIGVAWDDAGFGTKENAGSQAVVVGDNGRVLYTSDGGNTWEKLERVTPEHLVAIQFNAFDDFFYYQGGQELTQEFSLFEDSNMNLPFGNGIATGSVMYDWMAYSGSCGYGSPNDGPACTRSYDCTKPEISIVLRTNCGGTLTSTQWRCQRECTDSAATVPVTLENTLATTEAWNAYFGTTTVVQNGLEVTMPNAQRGQGKELLTRVRACDEVWTIGHGRSWHEDTRETRLSSRAERNAECLYVNFEDTKAIRPAHEMCMHGWPRHAYQLDKGRQMRWEDNATRDGVTRDAYTFLNRLRHSRENCTVLGGRYYEAETNHLEDCVFDFGTLQTCPSWEVHGMGHTLDPPLNPIATRIPFVNFSVITDPCRDEWFGVTCEDDHASDAMPDAIANRTVTQLWLYSNNLQGDIPSSISELHSLRSLSVGSNRLTGEIPRNVWQNMSDLKYLSLAENSLIGTIPDSIAGLGKLEELRVHANRISGTIPTQLGQLSYLQSLSLHANSLQGEIPSAIGELSSLQYLWMSNNNLTGAVPSELGNLRELRYFWFANNSLDSIPAELGELKKLRSIDGSNNTISNRLPYALGKLSHLRVMKFARNRLRATIPDALGSCISLVLLELQGNELVGPIPASFGALEELTTLDISSNLLERQLPESIEGMRSLQTLLLSDNNLEGGIPASIGTLRKLRKLSVARNLLTQQLPNEIANCDQLELVDLQGNRIEGPLPAGIWRLQLIEYLLMTGNRLRGPLPEGIGYLSQVREIRLDANRIDGTVPATIGDATTLEVVRLDGNALSGSIPSTVGKLRNVLTLDMHKNRLMGTIPAQISGMESMSSLYLHQNELTGQIPSTIGNLSSLKDLRLSQNTLTGVIPSSFGELGSLERLALHDNSIGGSIPEELGLLEGRIRVLHFQGNRLNGLLPTFFKQPEFRAVSINLANNELWCPLPTWPALNGTASCRHCPDDVYLDNIHRTCSDHGVCMDGMECRCDPRWTGDTCNLLRCPSACNGHGTCVNEREPTPCSSANNDVQNDTSVTQGMCENLSDDCVAAFHDCPQNGISVQVDSLGIVIAQEDKHNSIVYAKCICTDSYFGNDCSMPPLPPPTVEPWPDPYASGAQQRRRLDHFDLLLLVLTSTSFVVPCWPRFAEPLDMPILTLSDWLKL
eukprot:CAMPEP_0115841612 /NCGR_PEP_ID=MMETSP0287-20121206/7376_1 /TAXON_ID=412157 /ORGANISM="Chrysochromulina rotalis, Strain UIO044" /LENGTH=1520 /DNA_ID=CAMNT_0003295259 /DNA_START=20 /DNA_END=4582 /DNA_ORIENTATION=-